MHFIHLFSILLPVCFNKFSVQGTYVSLLGGIIRDRVKVSAYATVLRLSVCRRRLSSVMLCIVAKRYVLEQTLLLTAYRKSHMRNRLVPKQ